MSGFLRRFRFPLAAGAAVILIAVIASAQDPFRSKVTEVIVPVTVTTDKGLFVSDLDKEDFQIFDNGQEQTIEYFSRERNQPWWSAFWST